MGAPCCRGIKKNDRRIIAVASGFPNKKLRSSESLKLLNWGFRNTNTFEISKKNETIFKLETWLANKKQVEAITKNDYYITINKRDLIIDNLKLNELNDLAKIAR